MADKNDFKKKSKDTLADFFAKSPLRGSGLAVRRRRCLPREINFDGTVGRSERNADRPSFPGSKR